MAMYSFNLSTNMLHFYSYPESPTKKWFNDVYAFYFSEQIVKRHRLDFVQITFPIKGDLYWKIGPITPASKTKMNYHPTDMN